MQAVERIEINERASRWRVTWLPMVLIFLASAAVRLVLVRLPRVIWGDEPFYLWLGRSLWRGQGFAFLGHADVHHGPLYPILAGALDCLVNDLELASNILYVAFGSALVFPVYALARQIEDRRLGRNTALLVAVAPALTAATLHWGTLTEPLYMVLVYAGIWASVRGLAPYWPSRTTNTRSVSRSGVLVRQRPLWPMAVAGLCYGLAYLTRPEAIGYVGVTLLFWVALRLWRSRRANARFLTWRWGFEVGVYLGAFALSFLPYAAYVRQHTGAWMVSEKVGVAYLTGIGLAHGDTAAFDRATWGLDSTGLETFFFSSESYNVSMTDLILADPNTFVRVLYLNVRRMVQVLIDPSLLPYSVLPLVVLGLFGRGWSRERTVAEIFLVLSMAPVFAFTLFYIQARYIVPILPIFLLWMARGLGYMSEWLVGTVVELKTPRIPGKPVSTPRDYWHMPARWRRIVSAVPTLLVAAALLASTPSVLAQVTSVGSLRPAHRLIGEYLAPGSTSDTVIMSRYPAIAFHAGTRWVPTPNASLGDVLAYARHKGVTLWAIDERELAYRPQFRALVAPERVPDGLTLVARTDAGGEALVVYGFVSEG